MGENRGHAPTSRFDPGPRLTDCNGTEQGRIVRRLRPLRIRDPLPAACGVVPVRATGEVRDWKVVPHGLSGQRLKELRIRRKTLVARDVRPIAERGVRRLGRVPTTKG